MLLISFESRGLSQGGPFGDLRWKAPKPVVAWQGVKKADQFGNSCIQTIATERKPWTYEFMTHTEVSEDCLYLNVWTGAKAGVSPVDRERHNRIVHPVFVHPLVQPSFS
jgi:para-nitrobenzyl esterase